MAGEKTPMSDRLKKHFIDTGYWDNIPDELKYVYALIDMMKEQLEHEAGKTVSYRTVMDRIEHIPENTKEGLLSILPTEDTTT